MRGVTLSNGSFARIGVKHGVETTNGLKVFVLSHPRSTLVRLTVNGQEYTGKAVCNPKDNFSKLQGRKLAAIRLLSKLSFFSKQDKAAIFFNVCPEYAPGVSA